MARWSLFVVAFLALLAPCSFGEQQGGELAPPSASRSDRTTGGTQVLSIGGATIEVEIAAGSLDVHPSQILSWIERAARAVTTYYGRFPVQRVRVRVVTDSGQDDSIHGTTWGNVGGFQGVTRMRLGRHVTEQDLADDWTMTHTNSFTWPFRLCRTIRAGWRKAWRRMSSRLRALKPGNCPSGRCGRARSWVCRKGSLSEAISVWTKLAAGAAPTGEERCFVSSQMSRFAGRQRIAKDCRMRYALSLPLAVRSTKSGLY